MRLISPGNSALDWTQLQADVESCLSIVPPRQRLVIQLPNTPRLAASLLTCYRRGIVAVPVGPDVGIPRLSFIREHSKSVGLLTESGLELRTPSRVSPAADRLIIYTSGTTGNPKGVVLCAAAIEANATAVATLHRFGEGAHLTSLPLWHVNGLCMSLYGSWLSQSDLVLLEHFDASKYLDICGAHDVTTASTVPALLRRLVEARAPWPPRLRYLITAAAPLGQALAGDFYETYGARLRQGYGLSEAVNFSFIMPELSDSLFVETYVAQQPPVGLPIPGTRFRIESGEVLVAGPNLMRGYWRNREATRQALEGGWLRTGDLGQLRGDFLVLRGRRKEQINRGGESISPIEVEEELEWAGVQRPFAVVPVESESLGEEVGLIVEDPDLNQVLPMLETLPATHRPIAIAAMPLDATSTGKPRRAAMGHLLTCATSDPQQLADVNRLVGGGLAAMFPGAGAEASWIALQQVGLLPEFAWLAQQFVQTHCGENPSVSQCVVNPDGAAQNGYDWMWDWPGGRRPLIGATPEGESKRSPGPPLGSALLPLLASGFLGPESLRRAGADFRRVLPGALDAVVIIHGLSLSVDATATLERVHKQVVPGGWLILADEMSDPHQHLPLPLTRLLHAQRATVRGAGCKPRSQWIAALARLGCDRLTVSVLRAGRQDIGGLVCGRVSSPHTRAEQ